MATSDVDVVLFDLGGVLYDFVGVEAMGSLTEIDDVDELWRRWLGCPWVRAFERGDCTEDDFAAGVVDEWRLSIDPEAFLTSFRTWLRGPLEGADALVGETRRTVPVGCLSNTNPLHWTDFEQRFGLLESFDERFLSFELGCVKPDREIFDRVVAALSRPPDRILFLDDNVLNVEGAEAAGLRARRAVGVEGARRELAELGIVAPG
jgi:FMN phosphatase YigB (HAD superfamily)